MPKTDEAFAESLITAVDADDSEEEEKQEVEADEVEVDEPETDEAETDEVDEGETEDEKDESDEVDEEEGEPEPEEVTVSDDTVIKVRWDKNGPEEEATIGELRDGALRWKDYTQKTTELKAERAQMREEYMATLAQWAIQEEQEPDWGAYAAQGVPPAEIFKAQSEWRQKTAKSNEAKELYRALQADQAAEAEQARQESIQSEMAALYAAMPEFKSDETRPAALANVQKAASHIGLTNEEVQGITDHRIIRGLSLIAQHLESQESKPSIAKKVAKATSKTLPKNARQNRVDPKTLTQEARKTLKRKGDDDSFMNFLMTGAK